ncbi:MAG: molecular chaperone Tir [Acidobacteria bacterium]|nr:MAG: molecular chaperone Tir [Acidobacteriota bacterium]
MADHYQRVRRYLLELELRILHEDEASSVCLVEDEENGIKNLVVDCEEPILVLEQLIFRLPENAGAPLFKRLLQLNRTLVHGAYVLDEAGERVLFRDTLQLPTLDRDELEASIRALSLALAEHGGELLALARGRSG